MKLEGSLTDLVAAIFSQNSQAITFRPNQSTTYTAARDIQLPPGDTAHVLVSATSTQTLTNKTLTSPAINSPTGLAKADVGLGNVDNTSDATKNSAAVTLTNHTISGASNTLTVRAASDITGQLPTANGGTGQNSTATFPTSGVVVTEAGTETLTNKTISGASNTLTVRAANDITGQLPTANGGTGVSSTATFPTSGVVVTEAGTETLTNKTLGSTNTLTGATASSFTNTGTVTLFTATDTVVGRATTDALTNKDYQGGTASNISRITLPSNTTTNLASLTRKAGTLVYDTTAGAVNFDNGTTLTALSSQTQATASTLGVVQGGTLPGVTSGTDPAAGYIGELYQTVNSSAAIPNTATTLATFNLPAGLWSISGVIGTNASISTTTAYLQIGFSKVTNSFSGTTYGLNVIADTAAGASQSAMVSLSNYVVNISTTTTYYLVGQSQVALPSGQGCFRFTAIRIG